MDKQYWLVKQEPESYPWTQLVADKSTQWTGVRNYTARINLRAMKKGDSVLYYHSGEAREVVGIAKVAKAAYTDPTATEGDWSAVDIAAVQPLKKPVSLAAIKADASLAKIELVRNSRLSVMPIPPDAFEKIVRMGS